VGFSDAASDLSLIYDAANSILLDYCQSPTPIYTPLGQQQDTVVSQIQQLI
jgi:hypothetical protein